MRDAIPLAECLAAERTVLAELAESLNDDLALVRESPTVERLEAACERRHRIAHRLLELRERRRGANPTSSNDTEQLWIDLKLEAQRCRDLNERVGAFVAARIHTVGGMLGALDGGRRALRYDANARVANTSVALIRTRA